MLSWNQFALGALLFGSAGPSSIATVSGTAAGHVVTRADLVSQDPKPDGTPIQSPAPAVPPAVAPTATNNPAPSAPETPSKPRASDARAAGQDARYHTFDEVVAAVEGWVAGAKPETVIAATIELPKTGTGMPIPAFAFGAAGPVPLADRPTVFLLGGLDGISLSGCEAVLAACAHLLSDPDHLPRGVAFVAVPWASPEALAQMQAGKGGDGRDLTPIDDDGDDLVDEDGPDDVDGDGKILRMLVEDPAGPFVRSSDPRFLAPAREGDAPRYRLVPEGRDDDGDGRFNEDGPGGVCYDRAFPIGWRPGASPARGAELPLDLPPCRALADLALSRRTAAVLLFQGDHGGLARPGARRENPWPKDADSAAFGVAARLFAKATGRSSELPATLATVRGEERPGSAIDWFYAVPGALALEIAPWGPNVEKPLEAPGVGLADARFDSAVRAPAPNAVPEPSASDVAWARWLDNLRGGIGFVEWHPVELGEGVRALVGGWEPFSRLNPPEKTLPAAIAGMPEFVAEFAKALPTLELRVLDTHREGEICTIRARLGNAGALPTGAWTSGRAALAGTERPGAHAEAGGTRTEAGAARPEGAGARLEPAGARLEIELPAGARLLAGEAAVALGEIGGGGSSREVSWVVLAGPGSVLTLRASAPWAAPIAREVKP